MVVHHINLVCWQEIDQLVPADDRNQKIYCDSKSMYLICRLMGVKVLHITGSTQIPFLQKQLKCNRLTVLTPFDIDYFSHCQICVPEKLNDVKAYALEIESKIPLHNTVAIGISSPKQNKLGLELYKLRHDLDIFCIGAVVASFADRKKLQVISKLSNSGFEWLFHLIATPLRTISKLKLTIFATLCLLFRQRKQFLDFCGKLAKNEARK